MQQTATLALAALCAVLATAPLLHAQYTTPGLGQAYTLVDPVLISEGTVLWESTHFAINASLTIAETDSLVIDGEIVVHFAEAVLLTVQGTLLTGGGAELTVANCCVTHWGGMRFEGTSAGRLHHTTITYGGGIRVLTSNFEAINCHISHHNAVTSTGGALGLSGGTPLISYCTSEAIVGHLEPRQHQYCAEDRALPLFRKKTSNSTTYTTTAYPNPTQGAVSLKSGFGMKAVAL